MKTLILGLFLLLGMGISAKAAIVPLDQLNGSFTPIGPIAGATVNYAGFGFPNPTSHLFFSGDSLTYSLAAPTATSAFGGNWLFSLRTLGVTAGSTASLTVDTSGGSATSGPLGLVANTLNNFNFITLAGLTGNNNITGFTVLFGGIGGVTVDQIVATPEPASMLTAGCFSLVGGLLYRRRKLAKSK